MYNVCTSLAFKTIAKSKLFYSSKCNFDWFGTQIHTYAVVYTCLEPLICHCISPSLIASCGYISADESAVCL